MCKQAKRMTANDRMEMLEVEQEATEKLYKLGFYNWRGLLGDDVWNIDMYRRYDHEYTADEIESVYKKAVDDFYDALVECAKNVPDTMLHYGDGTDFPQDVELVASYIIDDDIDFPYESEGYIKYCVTNLDTHKRHYVDYTAYIWIEEVK